MGCRGGGDDAGEVFLIRIHDNDNNTYIRRITIMSWEYVEDQCQGCDGYDDTMECSRRVDDGTCNLDEDEYYDGCQGCDNEYECDWNECNIRMEACTCQMLEEDGSL